MRTVKETEMNEPQTVTAHNRLLYRGWNGQTTPAARPRRAHGAWVAAAPMLILLAAVVAAGLLVGAAAKASAQAHAKDVQVAGAEQMRRQALAMQAFRTQQYADAYGRFAALADDGDAEAAIMALAMVRSGRTLFGSLWSATPGQLTRWSALALHDLQRQTLAISGHDRGE
jgi:hypothetical protein